MAGFRAFRDELAAPDSAFYRYSTRCGRVRAGAISRAARKAGMSETAYVQAWFDRIPLDGNLDAPAAAPEAKPAAFVRPDAVALKEFADCYDVNLGAALVFSVLAQRARGRVVAMSAFDIAGLTGHTDNTVRTYFTTLLDAGILERESKAFGKRPASFRLDAAALSLALSAAQLDPVGEGRGE